MRHARARRLIVEGLDRTLPARRRLELDRHLQGCEACRQHEDEHAMAELLLEQMPKGLQPLELDPRAHARLEGLARWAETTPGALGYHRSPPVFALASAALILLMAATLSHWEPLVRPFAQPLGPIAYEHDSAYIAGSWSLTRF